ncbi:hypothetical protein [Roseofilum capinflatum]|uniref:Uncharacterized protein n=1 Tax=Roseofilum capinflatum BLCC-M114 TaxID=3022440 RepID=A0ABT7BD05_9CYAN|nr:hypothetical protein [Roseofilum capinflatum]MDJ1177055.1 hypothetical protein [Roseofilum capinflatum BLCC-M114]
MEEDLAKLEVLERSFVNFVYPFRFESEEYPQIIKHFQDSWEPRELRGISDYLLSPVANYLGIKHTHTHLDNRTAIFFEPTCELKKELNLDEEEVWAIKVKGKVIQFQFDSRTKTGRNGLNVPAVELALFKIGVGFLILRTHCHSNRLDEWMDFIYHFRFIGRKKIQCCCQKSNKPQHLKSIIKEKLLSIPDKLNWCKEIFIYNKMLAYFSIFSQGGDSEVQAKVIYRLNKFFHSGQDIYPHPSELEVGQEKYNILPYIENHYWLFSLEGGGFYGWNPPDTDWAKNNLVDHLKKQYFLIFILALHQRFALIHLSEQVAENWRMSGQQKDVENNIQVFQKIRDQMLLFTARGYFLQVMQQDNQHRCYCKWRDIFQLDALYTEVNGEVQEMHEYCLMQRDRQLQDTVYYMSAGLGSGAIVASTAGILFHSGGQSGFIGAVSLSAFVALITGYSVKTIRETKVLPALKQALIESKLSQDYYGCDMSGAVWRNSNNDSSYFTSSGKQ